MKPKTLLFIGLAGVASCTPSDEGKYKRGDCITPTDPLYSWHGEYALVDAYSRIEGFGKEKRYILTFPRSGSGTSIYDKDIELKTLKVSIELCGI